MGRLKGKHGGRQAGPGGGLGWEMWKISANSSFSRVEIRFLAEATRWMEVPLGRGKLEAEQLLWGGKVENSIWAELSLRSQCWPIHCHHMRRET